MTTTSTDNDDKTKFQHILLLHIINGCWTKDGFWMKYKIRQDKRAEHKPDHTIERQTEK